jgi:hypothetical protein
MTNREYQLREQNEQGQDTGGMKHFDTLDEAFQEFLTGNYWKLSFQLPKGRRVRLLMDRPPSCTITVTYPDEFVKEAISQMEG